MSKRVIFLLFLFIGIGARRMGLQRGGKYMGVDAPVMHHRSFLYLVLRQSNVPKIPPTPTHPLYYQESPR